MKWICQLFILLITISCTIFEETEHQVLQELYNNDKSYRAFLLLKKGNATVSNSLQVKVVPSNYKLKAKETGNIFIVDNIEGMENPIKLEWKENDTLVLHYNYLLNVYLQEKNINNISIYYVLKK